MGKEKGCSLVPGLLRKHERKGKIKNKQRKKKKTRGMHILHFISADSDENEVIFDRLWIISSSSSSHMQRLRCLLINSCSSLFFACFFNQILHHFLFFFFAGAIPPFLPFVYSNRKRKNREKDRFFEEHWKGKKGKSI